MSLFSKMFRCSFPYNSIWVLAALARESKFWIFTFKTGLIVRNRFSLCLVKRGHDNKKCSVDSIPVPQWQSSLGVSLKLWFFLWDLSRLSPTRSWNKYFKLSGSCILKVLCALGLIVSSNFFLKPDNVSILRVSGPKLFQVMTESG